MKRIFRKEAKLPEPLVSPSSFSFLARTIAGLFAVRRESDRGYKPDYLEDDWSRQGLGIGCGTYLRSVPVYRDGRGDGGGLVFALVRSWRVLYIS